MSKWKPAVFFATDEGDYIDPSYFEDCEDAINYLQNFMEKHEEEEDDDDEEDDE